MFGDMFGSMEQMQQQLREKLRAITVEATAGDGAIRVTANAAREILNIRIDRNQLDWEDTEAVEDLVLVAVNRALTLAAEREAAESQNLLRDMLPPGLGGMFGG